MLGAAASVRDNHLKLDLVREALAYLLEDSLHSADIRIIELAELNDSHVKSILA
jgi:hypothetical protein